METNSRHELSDAIFRWNCVFDEDFTGCVTRIIGPLASMGHDVTRLLVSGATEKHVPNDVAKFWAY